MTVSIGVYPGFQEIELLPGEEYEGSFYIINPLGSSELAEYSLLTSPYNVTDNDYVSDFSSKNDHNLIADWITFSEYSGSIEPNSKKEIKYKIKVPEFAPIGGQYGAIIVRLRSSNSESSSSGVNVNSVYQTANIIYAKIKGEYDYSGEVIKNHIKPISFSNKISTSSIVKNNGNIHLMATYGMKVDEFFSGNVIYSTEDQNKTNIVLPGTTLSSSMEWDHAPTLGIFRVTQTISFANEVSSSSSLVFLCPIWLIALWVAFISAIIVLLIRRSKKRKIQKQTAKNMIKPKFSR